jgi:hypothetical protein
MASEQWLLNDTSVANNAYFTAVTGGSYKLQNTFGSTRNRVTSSPTPYEGAGCYASGLSGEDGIRFRSSASADLTGTSGTYYFDSYVYLPTGFTNNAIPLLTANDAAVTFSWVQPYADTSLGFAGYDTINGVTSNNATATGAFSTNAWFRIQAKINEYGINEIRVFVGGNIDGASPSTTLTPFNFSTLGFTAYQRMIGLAGNANTYPFYLDSIKFDDAAYPTRGGTAHTAAGSATGTATGTAAMSSSRVGAGSGSETATGTAAASNQRPLAGTSSVTASATAAMSSTQVMGASGIGTASGTAAGAITAVVTIDGAATGTASGTAGASSTQVFAGSATVTATGTADSSIRPIVTVSGSGTITATGTTTFNKSQTLAASASATASATASLIAIQTIAATASVTATATATLLITTPGSLYGNATKVAGLYGSSTKPTLTTRS